MFLSEKNIVTLQLNFKIYYTLPNLNTFSFALGLLHFCIEKWANFDGY